VTDRREGEPHPDWQQRALAEVARARLRRIIAWVAAGILVASGVAWFVLRLV
jgi:hypothetical protein